MAIAGEGIVVPCRPAMGTEISICGTEDMAFQERSANLDFISYIIPTYNEGEKLHNNLLECYRAVSELRVPFEIVIVNDGSVDNTWSEILRFAKDHPEAVPITYSQNRGKGHALRVGIRSARGNLVVFLDADMEIHPSQTGRFIEEMRRAQADVVIGSKRHPESKVDYPMKRKLLS